MEKILKTISSYMKKHGYAAQLQAHMRTREHEHFKKLVISKSGLALLDAVHCLYDLTRTRAFLREIQKQVTAQSVVLEAGIGTGILSIYAATKARRVYGIEINAPTFALAKKVQAYVESKGLTRAPIVFTKGDATNAQFPEKADVIINENIYTGLFFEQQIQIARNLRKYLKPRGVMIPARLRSYAVLCSVSGMPSLAPGEMIVPIELRTKVRITQLTKPFAYDDVTLARLSKRGVRHTEVASCTRSGTATALLIYTEVHMPSGACIRRNQTEFLNNDILLGLPKKHILHKGNKIRVSLAYRYGAQPSDARLALAILPS